MRRPASALLALALLGGSALALCFATEAGASIAYESPYTFEQTFGSALRLVRVDLGLKVTEKDTDSGYLLFDYTSPESGKQVHKGALELVRASRGVRVTVQLPALPSYHEQMMVDLLAKKLATEHGEPPPAAASKPKAPPDDAGAGADDAGAP